jgi:hypothetical protein
MKHFYYIIIASILIIPFTASAQVSFNAGGVNGGAIIIGESTDACDGTIEGAVRYRSSTNSMDFCNGTNWESLSSAVCGDVIPSGLSFTDLPNESTSTLVMSNITQITSLGCEVGTNITGEGSPNYRICSDATCSTVIQDWTSGGSVISANQYVQLRLTSSAAGGDTFDATMTVGGSADVWNVTPTGDCSSSPAVGTVCVDGTVYAGLTPDGNVPMYVTRCDAGQTWDGSNCTGVRLNLPWNDGNTNYTYLNVTNSISGENNTINSAPLDANNVTAGIQDHLPIVHCNNLNQDTHTDWYLPSTAEMQLIQGAKDSIGNLTGTYNTSTENGTSGAVTVTSTGSAITYRPKTDNQKHRCARK